MTTKLKKKKKSRKQKKRRKAVKRECTVEKRLESLYWNTAKKEVKVAP